MKLAGAIEKELRLLWRDRWGMAMMLLMPTLLVVILTLAQEDAFKTLKSPSVTLLWADEDGQAFSRELKEGLERSGYFHLARELGGRALGRTEAVGAVAAGAYKVCVVVPRGVSSRVRKKVKLLAREAAQGETAPEGTSPEAQDSPSVENWIEVYFDPAVPESFRRSVVNGLGRAAQAVEMKWLFVAFSDAMAGPYGSGDDGAEKTSRWEPGQSLEIRERFARPLSVQVVPSALQQNVPAWSLFAMFLVAIPLSCSLIRERDSGSLLRLRMLPVSYATILLGKVLSYLVFCLLQFGFILLLGFYALPRLGTPQLVLGGPPLAVLATAVASGLAATGFGVLVGSVARTTDQATIVGTTFAVIGGAIGGIMIPAFLMPRPMQALSPYSPLHWGLDAFLAVFLRGAGLREILPQLALLLAFSAGCVGAAALWLGRREDSPLRIPFPFRRVP